MTSLKKLLGKTLLATACLGTAMSAAADVLSDIKARDEIRIAVPQDFPPFGSVGADLKP